VALTIDLLGESMEAFAWPGVALILGLVTLILFRPEVRKLINRTQKVGKGWLEAAKPEEQASPQKGSGVDEFITRTYQNQLLIEQEERIRNHLDSLKPASAAERETFLLKSLAATTLIQAFERTYYLIYGSQIRALEFLNDSRHLSVKPGELEPIYQEVTRQFPESYEGYPFERWLDFLVSSNLIRVDGAGIAITVFGKEFLKYLLDQGLSFRKLR
jgi:hypothetical protein